MQLNLVKIQQFNAMLRRVAGRWTYGASNSRASFLGLRYVFSNSGIRSRIICRWQNWTWFCLFEGTVGGTAAAAPPPSGLATLPSVGAVP